MGDRLVLATLETPRTTRTLNTTSTVSRTGSWTETADLVTRAQSGDRVAFGALVEQYEKTVYSVCLGRLRNPSEAAEMTQEVFLHVYKRLDQLREPERFAGWLRQVAARMAINRATRRVPPPSVEVEVLEAASGQRHEPIDELIARERARKLWDALGRLKPIDREALVAFYIQGQALNEIADTLDVPLGTIKRRLHTARKRLKTLLEAGSSSPDEWIDGRRDEVDDDEAAEVVFGL
ncbi:MAG TPA: sigma-70 family RNA polymerase sigma factor [Isosphaeraceae bacterium]|jgi:RNA polymerase sigma-70 factor (ECF subfamily)|nr:sigma-70 family RNA polymerase sigma factor [Isosphaeraceae bacterium]